MATAACAAMPVMMRSSRSVNTPGSAWPKNRPPSTSPDRETNRNRQVAAHRRAVAFGPPRTADRAGIAGISTDIVRAHGSRSAKRCCERLRHRAASGTFGDRLTRRIGKGVKGERRAAFVRHAGDERSELRPGDLGAGLGDGLDQALEIKFPAERHAGAIEDLQRPRLLAHFGDARLQHRVDRQQPGLERLALGDVVTGSAQPARATLTVANDLPPLNQPMNAAVTVSDTEFRVEHAGSPGGLQLCAQLRHVVGEDRGLPVRERRPWHRGIEAEQHRDLRRGQQRPGRQIEFERAGADDGRQQALLGLRQVGPCVGALACVLFVAHRRAGYALRRHRMALASVMARSFPRTMCRGR